MMSAWGDLSQTTTHTNDTIQTEGFYGTNGLSKGPVSLLRRQLVLRTKTVDND